MFWETLWALVLGFTLSGVVQAFVPKEQMRAKLGDHRPASVARASGYGMVSSSCSYAASAMAKSLFAKGADFTSSMVFMIASTNLVVELGLVMLVLLGWQFAVAEFVGGPIMIVLLALTGGFVFTPRLLAAARARLGGGTPWRPRPRRPGRGVRGAPGRARGRAVGHEAAVTRRLVGRLELRRGRRHHAAQGAGDRVHGGGPVGRPGPRPRVERAVPPGSRLLDDARERHGRDR